MVKLAGVVPVGGGVMLSQELPEVTDAVTLVELAGDDPMVRIWEPGGETSPSV